MAWRVLEIWLAIVKEPSALLIPGKDKAQPTQSLGKPLAGQKKRRLELLLTITEGKTRCRGRGCPVRLWHSAPSVAGMYKRHTG